MDQGRLDHTGRPLDLAIEGNGFFKVRVGKPDSESIGYTRNGELLVNDQGQIVLPAGDGRVVAAPFTVPLGLTDICVGEDGIVSIVKPGATTRAAIGQIKVCQFANPAGLKRSDGGIYSATQESGNAIESNPGESGAGTILQGYLEASNVSLNQEMLRLQFLKNWRESIIYSSPKQTLQPRLAQTD